MRWFSVIVMMIGTAELRTVPKDWSNIIKNLALNSRDAGTQGVSMHNMEEETSALGNGKGNIVDLMSFNNLEDLAKYYIELKYKLDNDGIHSQFNLADPAGGNKKNFVKDTGIIISENLDDDREFSDIQKQNIWKGRNERNFFKLLENSQGDNFAETAGEENEADIFKEDEYEDYVGSDETAKQLWSEEDETEEDRSYDEDESYYKDFENLYEYSEEESYLTNL